MSFWSSLFYQKPKQGSALETKEVKPESEAIPTPPPKEEGVMDRAAEVIGQEIDSDVLQPDVYYHTGYKTQVGIENPRPLEDKEQYVVERATDGKRYELSERPMVVHITNFGDIAASKKGDDLTITYWAPEKNQYGTRDCERMILKKVEAGWKVTSREVGTYSQEGVQYEPFLEESLPPKINEYGGIVKLLIDKVLTQGDIQETKSDAPKAKEEPVTPKN